MPSYMHVDLKEKVFMHQPPDFCDPNFPSHVCRLHKSLYDLKQAPRAQFDKCFKLSEDLDSHKHLLVIVLVYVDDILISGLNPSISKHFIQKFKYFISSQRFGSITLLLRIISSQIQR